MRKLRARRIRRRLPAEEAKSAILDAAERQLVARGPDGIRLADLAAELGISHPTILHHFGSRDELVRAVVERAVASLQRELVAILTSATAETTGEQVADTLLRRVSEALGERKQARTMAWLYLEGERGRGKRADDVLGHGAQLRQLADLVHAQRAAHRASLGRPPPDYDDTLFTVALASFAMFGHALSGAALEAGAGVEPTRFVSWLARLLLAHLERD